MEDMGYEGLVERVNELAPIVDEHENLRAILHLLDEGFITIDDDGQLWPVAS